MKITLSKSQWETIGKRAGWIKMARTQIMYVSFVDELLFDGNADVKYNVKHNGVNPENVWEVDYNIDAFNDNNLTQKIIDETLNLGKVRIYKELFHAYSIRAVNWSNGTVKTSDELISLIMETLGIDRFWSFLKENEEIYKTEALREEEEMKYTDDQQEARMPDTLRPSY